MKVVIDRQIPGLREGIAELYPEYDVAAFDGKEIKPGDVADADALIVRTRTRCDAALLKCSRVKLVGTATIGTDHIDLEWCRKNGIKVVNAPGCNAPAVMQYVASSLHEAGFDPQKHTLGVIGKGNIGSLVVDLYRRAGCRVLVCDPPRKEAGMTDEDYKSQEEVLEESDAVTIHVPYTEEGKYPTKNLLQTLPSEKPEIIINASRGGVLAPDLLPGEGEKRKFIIDTWPFEENPELYSEREREDIIRKAFISTPHIAGYSAEGKGRATRAMLAALGGDFECGYADEVKAKALLPLNTVIDSFSPVELSRSLKSAPHTFESLRSGHLRREPK